MTRKALISGITGQDGAFLAQLLLENGYVVYGGLRRSSSGTTWRLAEANILDRVNLVELELLDYESTRSTLVSIRPNEFYNLGGQSFVKSSFQQPIYTTQVNGVAVTNLLEIIREELPDLRFYQASTSEMFGNAIESPQRETTSLRPQSPYAASKAYAHWITANYRSAYELFACSGILFNHESHFRGLSFVTRKISSTLARMASDTHSSLQLSLGNLDAIRDWGYAGEYVDGMWRMLQCEKADDYVLATGTSHTVREFVEIAAQYLDYDIEWSGSGADEVGRDRRSGRIMVKVDKTFYRPIDVAALVGDAAKARCKLNWQPKTSFSELVGGMVGKDLERLKAGQILM